MDKDEEQLMKEKLQEIQLKAANKLRRRSTIVMGAQSMSPKKVKKTQKQLEKAKEEKKSKEEQ